MSKLTKEEQDLIQSQIVLAASVIEANRKEADRLRSLINTGAVSSKSSQGKCFANLLDEIQRQESEKESLESQLEEALTPVYREIDDLVGQIEIGVISASDLLFYTDREDGPTDYIIRKKDEYNTVMCVAMAETLAEKLLDQLGIAPREGWSPCDGW